jgi:8-oxo-dGTP pyrophosphatase MutT (NUDIX family)
LKETKTHTSKSVRFKFAILVNMDKNNISHRYAGVLLITEDDKIIGQQRDDKPGIDHPGKVGTFGGTVELGEDPLYAAWRELVKEETNLIFNENDLTLFCEDTAWRKLTSEWESRFFYYVKISKEQLDNLEVYEGQGWAEINGPDDPNIVDEWRPVIKTFLALKR